MFGPVVGVVALAAGVVLGALTLLAWQRQVGMQDGTKVRGTVIAYQAGSSVTNAGVIVRYPVDGASQTAALGQQVSNRLGVGDQVDLVYNPADPSSVTFADPPSPRLSLLWAASFCFTSALLLVYRGLPLVRALRVDETHSETCQARVLTWDRGARQERWLEISNPKLISPLYVRVAPVPDLPSAEHFDVEVAGRLQAGETVITHVASMTVWPLGRLQHSPPPLTSA